MTNTILIASTAIITAILALAPISGSESEKLTSSDTTSSIVIEAPPTELAEAIKLEQKTWEESQPKPPEPELSVMVTRQESSSVRLRNFSKGSGASLIDTVKSHPNGGKLWQAFFDRYGEEVADTAAVSLMYENSTMWELTTGVCNPKYQINGDYRNCNYADVNSAGFDAGLKQINTYWQRYRIAKLGGPSCEPINSRDRTDACTASQIAWLHNLDNNITIALDIYAESGFLPWYGYKKAFNF